MIVDCFTFFNELDILECRLEYLNSSVDYFVLVESNITFSGKQKPLYFVENQLRFEKYKSKIIYHPFIFDNSIYNFTFDNNQSETNYGATQWQIEYMQRNHIANAVKIIEGNPNIILGDVDEIPSIESINFCKDNLSSEVPAIALIMKLFFYNLSIMDPTEWAASIFTSKNFLLEKTPQFLRANHRNETMIPQVTNGGWHLTYFGNTEQIQYKIDSFSHQEYNKPENKSVENIISSINNRVGLFDKMSRYVSIEKNYFSKDFFDIFQRFYPHDMNVNG